MGLESKLRVIEDLYNTPEIGEAVFFEETELPASQAEPATWFGRQVEALRYKIAKLVIPGIMTPVERGKYVLAQRIREAAEYYSSIRILNIRQIHGLHPLIDIEGDSVNIYNGEALENDQKVTESRLYDLDVRRIGRRLQSATIYYGIQVPNEPELLYSPEDAAEQYPPKLLAQAA